MVYNLVISGTIGSWWNGCSADYVRYVLNQNKGKEVHVGFCSLGGYVKDGLEMNQAFRDHGNVHAHAFGMNASISTIAMLGCKTIDIVKGSFFLIHNVSVLIEKYEQSNKEQIDSYISKLKAQRDSLKNFDDVLASMYADKTGKTLDECLAQMKRGNWLTAQQALDFGLVDEIREDKVAEKAANEYTGNFVYSYDLSTQFKDAGIPPLPQPQASDDVAVKVASVVDGDGNPTQSFLQKTCEGLKSLFRNQHAANDNKPQKMIKIFAAVMALLNVTDGFKTNDEGNITLTQEQMKSIDDRLKALEEKEKTDSKALNDAGAALTKLKAQLAKAEEVAKQKDEQITALKASAGDDTNNPPASGEQAFSATDVYNLIKDV